MKIIFIDTNILLSFYHLTSEDIEELRKVVALIDTKKLELVVTDHLKNEFIRNRAGKIADAMKKFKEIRFNASFPAFAKSYDEFSKLRDLLQSADKVHSDLMKKLTDDAIAKKLNADSLVSDLFKKAKLIAATSEINGRAVLRKL